MSRLQELKDLVASFEKDFVKFYDKGNKSAGTRVRKSMNELKKKAQEIRKEVQEIKAQAKTTGTQFICKPVSTYKEMRASWLRWDGHREAHLIV